MIEKYCEEEEEAYMTFKRLLFNLSKEEIETRQSEDDAGKRDCPYCDGILLNLGSAHGLQIS